MSDPKIPSKPTGWHWTVLTGSILAVLGSVLYFVTDPGFKALLALLAAAVALMISLTNRRKWTDVLVSVILIALFLGGTVFILWPRFVSPWKSVYDAAQKGSWPAWCVRASPEDKPTIVLNEGDNDNSCFHDSFDGNLDDFRIQWKLLIDGGIGIAIVGQKDNFYFVAIRPTEDVVSVARVESGSWRNIGQFTPSVRLRPAKEENTLEVTRKGRILSISINGTHVTDQPDALFSGDPIPIQVGFGASLGGAKKTSVQLNALVIQTPR